MLRIILADDERLTLEAIKVQIRESGLEAEVIGEAANGLGILDLLLHTEADVLITDIRMPVMNGISLMKSIKEMGLRVKVVVLSAYRDFGYAQEAVNNGACGYLLKPLRREKLIAQLREVEVALARERERERRSVPALEGLLRELAAGRGAGAELPQALSVALSAGYRVVLVEGEGGAADPAGVARSLEARLAVYAAPFAAPLGGRVLLCLGEAGRTGFLLRTAEAAVAALWPRALIGVSSAEVGPEGFPSAMGEAEAALSRGFYRREPVAVVYHDPGQPPLRPLGGMTFLLEEALIGCVLAGDTPGARQAAAGIGGILWERGDALPGDVARYYISLVYRLQGQLYRKYGEDTGAGVFEGVAERLAGLRRLEGIQALVEELAEDVAALGGGYRRQGSPTKAEQIRRYCQENYHRCLSLDTVADHMGLTKNYLCHIFKEQTGTSFWDYLVTLRIEKAKELLLRPDTRASQVAGMVGYGNAGYFGQVFKARVGMTPMEYKKYAVNTGRPSQHGVPNTDRSSDHDIPRAGNENAGI